MSRQVHRTQKRLPGGKSPLARRAARFAVVIGVVALLLGCATDPYSDQPRLPYRIAVVPFDVGRVLLPGEAASGNGVTETSRLQLDSRRASRTIAERLTARCFAAATVLSFPEGEARRELEGQSREQRDAHWLDAASAAGANLLMECDLKVASGMKSSLNEKFWLTLPLFLIGGPAAYFVDDRSYRTDARLQVTIHLLDPLVDGRASVADGRAQLLKSEVRFEEASLDFLDRATWNPLPYFLSLLVPCGFLEVENDRVRRQVEEKITEQLTAGLERELREASLQMLRADQAASFFLDPAVAITVEGRDLRVHGEAVLRLGNAQRLDGYSIAFGSHKVEGELVQGSPDLNLSTEREHYVRYGFQGRLPRDSGASSLEIEIWAGGRDRERRSFCVPLPDAARGR